jgi:hypothetical protein
LPREERPRDDRYYERRLEFLSQGDIFRDVPLAYPFPPGEIVEDPNATSGARQFLSGPFEFGHAILLTPTCSMRAQRTIDASYAHPVRVLAVIRPTDELLRRGILTADRLGLMRKYDGLVNYLYLPEYAGEFSESVALLYMTVILHHDLIERQRITQLSYEGAQQLQRKLVWFNSGLLFDRCEFKPPMD